MKKFKLDLDESGVLHHVAIIGAFIVLFGAIGMYLVISSKAATPAATVPGSPLCSGKGCLSDLGKTGADNPVELRAQNAGANQNITVAAANICGGSNSVKTGKNGCPFPPSSDLNSDYFSSDKIYYLKFKGTCVSVNGTTYVVTGACNSNAAWVRYNGDQYASVGTGGSRVSGVSTASFLDNGGINNQIRVRSFTLSGIGGVGPSSWTFK